MLPSLTSRIVTFPTTPNVGEEGEIVAMETLCEGVGELEAASRMSSSDAVNVLADVDKIHATVRKPWNLDQSQPRISEEQVGRIGGLCDSITNSQQRGS